VLRCRAPGIRPGSANLRRVDRRRERARRSNPSSPTSRGLGLKTTPWIRLVPTMAAERLPCEPVAPGATDHSGQGSPRLRTAAVARR
jgi:hypothetical protein